MSSKYLIGIDGGTEGIRAGIFDLFGNPIAFAATTYNTHYPEPSWAEQQPEDWWQACGKSVKKALKIANIDPSDVAGISVDTTCCSVILLNKTGKSIRPALIWMDVRATEEADIISKTADNALCVNSNGQGPVSAEWMLPKSLWLKTHEPDNYHQAETVCEYQDFINLKLTGRLCSSINNVSVRWHHSIQENMPCTGVPVDLLDKIGLADIEEKWPKEVLKLGDKIGDLTASAAKYLGLVKGTPVAQGGADAFIGMIGLGVIKPGGLAFITGSSHLLLGLSSTPFNGTGVWGTYPNALVPNLHVVEGGQTSTGSIISWFKRTFAADVDYKTLDAEAEEIAPGAEGLVALDHFQGNRTPYTDAHSRGAFTGLSLGHTRGHMFRSLMESVAFGSRLILDAFETNGFSDSNLVLSGGVTNSPLWLQIHADILGKPLTLTKVADAPALGSAILAGVGCGVFANIEEGVNAMVHHKNVIEPCMETHQKYASVYEQYKALYHAQKQMRT